MLRPPLRQSGFTLIELVVTLAIFAVLSGVAVAVFIDLGRSARIAAVTQLAGVVRGTADHLRAVCLITPSCSSQMGQSTSVDTLGGRPLRMNYGWADAGDSTDTDEIDAWIVHTGFTAATVYGTEKTRFSLDDAPDPPNCAVTYEGAFGTGDPHVVVVATRTSGC